MTAVRTGRYFEHMENKDFCNQFWKGISKESCDFFEKFTCLTLFVISIFSFFNNNLDLVRRPV